MKNACVLWKSRTIIGTEPRETKLAAGNTAQVSMKLEKCHCRKQRKLGSLRARAMTSLVRDLVRPKSNVGGEMRWVAFLCFFFFNTAAWALDDCNTKFPSTSQLEDRLKCLQSNNNSLQSQIDTLKPGASVKEAIAKPEPQLIAKPMAKPVAKPIAKPVKLRVATPQPLTRANCKKAGMQWNSNANVCASR